MNIRTHCNLYITKTYASKFGIEFSFIDYVYVKLKKGK